MQTWYSKYCTEAWLKRFRDDFQHKFSSLFEDPDDTAASAIELLLFKKLPAAKLKNNLNPDAFVMTSFRNVVRDLSREQNGYYQAPTVLARNGEAYAQIFFEYCFQKNPLDVISERLKLPVESVRYWVSWLRAEQKCPHKKYNVSLNLQPDEADTARIDRCNASDDSVLDSLERESYSAIVHWMLELDQPRNSAGEREAIKEQLSNMPRPNITDQERLLLKLIYWEGHSLTNAAQLLRQKRFTIRNQHTALLKRLRKHFVTCGIEL